MRLRALAAFAILFGLTALVHAEERMVLEDWNISAELRLVCTSNATFETIQRRYGCTGKAITLTEKQRRECMESLRGDALTNIQQMPKVTMPRGQRVTVEAGEIQFFMTEICVKGAENGQVIGCPVNHPHFLGSRFEMQGTVSCDREIAIQIKANHSEVAETVPLFPITMPITPVFDGGAHGEPVPFTQYIQLPKFQRLAADESAVVPEGGTLLIKLGQVTREARNEFGPPILSKIPYLRRLFTTVGYGRQEYTMLLLVTPRFNVGEDEGIPHAKGGISGCGSIKFEPQMLADNNCPTITPPRRTNDCKEKTQAKNLEAPPTMAPSTPNMTTGKQMPADDAPKMPEVFCNRKSPPPAAAPLSIANVVFLATHGVSDEIILNQIRTTGVSFTLCAEDIVHLKKNSVSDAVVLAMQNSRSHQEPTTLPVSGTCPVPMPIGVSNPGVWR